MIATMKHLEFPVATEAVGVDASNAVLQDIYTMITNPKTIGEMEILINIEQPPIEAFKERLEKLYADYHLDKKGIEQLNKDTAKLVAYVLGLFGYCPYEEPPTNKKVKKSRKQTIPYASPLRPFKELTLGAKYKQVRYGECYHSIYNAIGVGANNIIPLKIESEFKIKEQ